MWKLTKVSNNINDMRTNEIIGRLGDIPQVGHSITIISEPLDPRATARLFQSSPITKILPSILINNDENQKREPFYATENSIYRLENLNCEHTDLFIENELGHALLSILKNYDLSNLCSEHDIIIKLINEYDYKKEDFVNLYNNRYRFKTNGSNCGDENCDCGYGWNFVMRNFIKYELIYKEFYKEELENGNYFYENYYLITIDGLIFLQQLSGN